MWNNYSLEGRIKKGDIFGDGEMTHLRVQKVILINSNHIVLESVAFDYSRVMRQSVALHTVGEESKKYIIRLNIIRSMI